MSIITIPRDIFDDFNDDIRICVFCDNATTLGFCPGCEEYKGLMTIAEWEDYTGETWED